MVSCLSSFDMKSKGIAGQRTVKMSLCAGERLIWHPPYLEDKLSQKRIAQGLHVPVQSCWNGLVALRAAPFLMGLKFRYCVADFCRLGAQSAEWPECT